jgi:hypothetical protein
VLADQVQQQVKGAFERLKEDSQSVRRNVQIPREFEDRFTPDKGEGFVGCFQSHVICDDGEGPGRTRLLNRLEGIFDTRLGLWRGIIRQFITRR